MVEMVADAQNGLDRVQRALELKDDYVDRAFLSLDAKHDKFHARFDDYFKTVTEDRKRIETKQMKYKTKKTII